MIRSKTLRKRIVYGISLLLPDVIGRGTLINIYVKISILKQSSCERDV